MLFSWTMVATMYFMHDVERTTSNRILPIVLTIVGTEVDWWKWAARFAASKRDRPLPTGSSREMKGYVATLATGSYP